VRFDLKDAWHIYAADPGDAGLPTRVRWKLPEGIATGPLMWPTPRRFREPGNLVTFGYTGTVVVSSRITVEAELESGQTLPIRANVEWLACKELCIPGRAQLELALPVRPEPPAPSRHAGLLVDPAG
jgi:thiol:disulfide interchange protein DsbD